MAITIKGKRGSASSSSSKSKKSKPTNTTPSTGTEPVGKIRKYLPATERYWNPNSPDTPEGRLSKYNLEDWYPPVKDDHGHSVSLRIDLHPVVVEELTAIVNSGDLPLRKSLVNALRVCVQEMLPVLRRLAPQPNSHAALIETLTYLNASHEITAQYEVQFESGKKRVLQLLAMDAKNEARKAAHDLISLAQRIPIKELRKKYTYELKKMFKGLLRGGKPVKVNVAKNGKRKKHREPWE